MEVVSPEGRWVFISYSSLDQRFVRRLHSALEEQGFPTWLDEKRLIAGDPLAQTLSIAIERAGALLVVVSTHSLRSDWLAYELNLASERAVKEHLRIIPVLIDGERLPPELKGRVYADFRRSFKAGLARVIAALDAEQLRSASPPSLASPAEAIPNYDPSSDGMYAINVWSPDRQLTPARLRVTISDDRPEQRWVDEAAWAEQYEHHRNTFTGRCGYVTDYGEIDFREGPTNQVFSVTVSPMDYAEGTATWKALEADPDAQGLIADTLAHNPRAFVRSAPPMRLAANVAVLSPESRFLVIKRSASVESSPNILTVGPNETLTLPEHPQPGTHPEDFFELVRRCLKEEVGLDPPDYRTISISWFGYYAPQAHPWILAQVRTNLSEAEVDEKMRRAHSRPEAASWLWLPLTAATVRQIVAGRRTGQHTLEEDSADARTWIIHAPLAVTELWRMQPAL